MSLAPSSAPGGNLVCSQDLKGEKKKGFYETSKYLHLKSGDSMLK